MSEKRQIGIDGGQVPALYRRQVGGIEVTAVSDGYFKLPDAVWTGVAADELAATIRDAFLPPVGFVRNAMNTFLVNTGSRLRLIDAGAGDLLPTGGGLTDNLARVGVRPADIDEVLVTHMHPDHVGGLIKDGTAVFPNATVRIARADIAYWESAAEQAQAHPITHTWFDAARGVLAAYAGRVEPISGRTDLGGGVTAVPLPGHTPGHTGYLIDGGAEQLLVWGDAAIPPLHFPRPDVGMIWDVDPAAGRATRRQTFDWAAGDRLLVTGTHLPFPSFGYVARRGGQFEWLPEYWRYAVRPAE